MAWNPLNAAVNNFGVLGGSRVDLASGSLAATGNPLDLAVAGTGFFAVQSAEGVVYTRDGGFPCDSHGTIGDSSRRRCARRARSDRSAGRRGRGQRRWNSFQSTAPWSPNFE